MAYFREYTSAVFCMSHQVYDESSGAQFNYYYLRRFARWLNLFQVAPSVKDDRNLHMSKFQSIRSLAYGLAGGVFRFHVIAA